MKQTLLSVSLTRGSLRFQTDIYAIPPVQIEKSTFNVYPYSEKPTDEADVELTSEEVT